MDQSRFANLASASASASASTHSAQSDAAELGLSSPSQQEVVAMPESISPDNLYGNEDDDANLRAMDNEDLGLTSPAKSHAEVHKAALQFGAKASMLMQKRPSRAPLPVALAAAAADEVNTQESDASMAPKDEFATKGHFMLIPGTSCKSLSPTVTDGFCLSSCASGKAGSCPPALCKCVNNAIPPPADLMGPMGLAKQPSAASAAGAAVGEDAAAAFLGGDESADAAAAAAADASASAADAARTNLVANELGNKVASSSAAEGSTALGAVNGTIVTVNASEMAAMLRRATTLVSAPVEPTT